MSWRVKVHGPSVTHQFGVDIFDVESLPTVADDGLLIVHCPPYPGRPAVEHDPDRPSVSVPARKATGPSRVVYPRGGWTKVTITETLEEES